MLRLAVIFLMVCRSWAKITSVHDGTSTSSRSLTDSQPLFVQSEMNLSLNGLSARMTTDVEDAFILTTADFVTKHLLLSQHQVKVQIASQGLQSNSSGLEVAAIITMEYYYDSQTMLPGPISFHSDLQKLFDGNSGSILVASLRATGLQYYDKLVSITTAVSVQSPQYGYVVVEDPTTVQVKTGFTIPVVCVFVILALGLPLSFVVGLRMIQLSERRYVGVGSDDGSCNHLRAVHIKLTSGLLLYRLLEHWRSKGVNDFMNTINAVVDEAENVDDGSEKDDEAPADPDIMLLSRNMSEDTSKTCYTADQCYETPLSGTSIVSNEMEPQQSVLGSLSVSKFMPSSSQSWVHWVKTNHGNGGPSSVSDISESIVSEIVDDIDLGDYDTLNRDREGWYMTQHQQHPTTQSKSLMMGGMDNLLIMAKRATKLSSRGTLLPSLDDSSNNSSESRIFFDAEQLSI